MRLRRGITLVEVLVAAFLSAMIAGSLATAFAATVQRQQTRDFARKRVEARAQFEDTVRNLLQQAYFDSATPERTFFQSDQVSGQSSYADVLRFTTVSGRFDPRVAASTDTDFSARNENFGPVGGLTEVELSTTPVGDGATGSGLFLRKQTPADSEPTTGGRESLLNDQVQTFSLEFWDSNAWIESWDAEVNQALPTAVRVHYTLEGDDTESTFVVNLPNAPTGGGA